MNNNPSHGNNDPDAHFVNIDDDDDDEEDGDGNGNCSGDNDNNNKVDDVEEEKA